MEIKSISFFNPDARKAANPDEHPCPVCGSEMDREWRIKEQDMRGSPFPDPDIRPVLWHVCKCGHAEKVK